MWADGVPAWPDGWTVDVTVRRGGGRDSRGNPQPETVLPRSGVLFGWRATSDPVDRSELTDDTAVLYDMAGGFTWEGGDRVDVAGVVWQVDGTPKRWPLGWEVPVRRSP